MWAKHKQRGFTIVELLIVIVVIGILAAITLVAYTGVQNQANDASIKSDLNTIAKKLNMYRAENSVYPAGYTQLATLGIRLNKNAYGNHFNNGSGTFNLVYCRMPDTGPTQFALVAFSKTGKNYQYTGGGELKEYTGAPNGSVALCSAAGVPLTTGSERDWFYDSGGWQGFVAG